MATECRACMSVNSSKYVQMDSLMEDDFSYLDFFNEHTKLNATIDDSLPNKLCKNCIDSLHTMYKFIKFAKKMDAEFRAVLQYFEIEGAEEDPITESNETIKLHDESADSSQNSMENDEIQKMDNDSEAEAEEDISGDLDFPENESSDDSVDLNLEPVEIVDPLPFEPDDHYLVEYDPNDRNDKKWLCAVCNVWLRGDVSVEGHTNIHSNMHPYECKRCSCKFRSKYYLERHDKTDHNVVPLSVKRKLEAQRKCQVCRLQFKSLKQFNAHECKGKPKLGKKVKQEADTFQRPMKRRALPIPNFRIVCPSCDEIFTSVKYLGLHNCQKKKEAEHIDLSTINTPSSLKLTCLSCSGTFSTLKDLSQHNCKKAENKTTTELDSSSKYIMKRTCWACSHIFMTAMELKKHKCTVEQQWLEFKKMADRGIPNFPCSVCSKNFISMKSLSEHICVDGKSVQAAFPSFAQEVEYNIKVITAPLNDEVSELIELDDGTVKCPYCDVRVQKETLHAHVRKEHPDKYRIGRNPDSKYLSVNTDADFVCDYCEIDFVTLPEKRSHMLEVHRDKVGTEINEKGEVVVKCNLCKAVVTKRYYPRHMESHQKLGKKYTAYLLKCCYCSQTLPHEKALTKHEETMHVDQKDNPGNECTYCFKKYFHFRLLKKHIYNIHLQKYACKCSGCGKKFKSKEDMLVHKRAQQYECEFCQKLFNCYGGFRRHVNEHKTGASQLVCELCGKVLSNSTALKTHLRSHEKGTIRHQMPIDKVFSYKRYFCHLCVNFSFGKRYSFVAHLKTVHGLDMSGDEDLSAHFRYTAIPKVIDDEIDDE